MIKIISAEDRNFNDFGWLQTYWLFSFSNYYDPDNLNHGKLRVFNDDVVEPGTGFDTHPHEEMEIVSIVLDGEMTHRDSMGNETVIRAGDVQRMTAGTGVQHSERNMGSEPVAFFQIWILPGEKGQQPSYDQKSFAPEDYRDRMALLASGKGDDNSVLLNTDAEIFRGAYSRPHEENYRVKEGRVVFIYVIDGELSVNGKTVGKRDQVRIEHEAELAVKGSAGSDFILIDVPGTAAK